MIVASFFDFQSVDVRTCPDLPGFGGSGLGPLKNGEFGSSSSFGFGGTGFDSSTFCLVKNR